MRISMIVLRICSDILNVLHIVDSVLRLAVYATLVGPADLLIVSVSTRIHNNTYY